MAEQEKKALEPMGTYEDFRPRQGEVKVGDTARALVVRELSIAKRDAVVRVLVDDAKLLTVDGPIMTALRGAGKAALDGDVGALEGMNSEFVRGIAELALKVLGSTLSTLSCLVLDCKENRDRLSIKGELKEHKLGFEHSPELWAWLQQEMTPRQEQAVIELAIEVNDFRTLLGKYWAVARKAMPQKVATATAAKTKST